MASLLPINASQLQRDLESVNGFSGELQQAIWDLPHFKEALPDHLFHWLIWEYGLEEILPYLLEQAESQGTEVNLRGAIQQGLQWQRLRGTPQSLHMALNWIGFSQAELEETRPGEHFFEYQLDPGLVPERYQLPFIKGVSKVSSPVRSRLSRLYHGYDRRKLVLSESSRLGDLLSDHSGVRNEDGVCLSFGRTAFSHVSYEVPQSNNSVTSRYFSSKAQYVDRPILDFMQLGNVYRRAASSGFSRLMTHHERADSGLIYQQSQRIAQSALVLSQSAILGDIDSVLDPRVRRETGHTLILSEGQLDTPHSLTWTPLNRRFRRDQQASVTAHFEPEFDAGISRAQTRALPVSRVAPAYLIERAYPMAFVPSEFQWLGGWDKRSWTGDANYVLGSHHLGQQA